MALVVYFDAQDGGDGESGAGAAKSPRRPTPGDGPTKPKPGIKPKPGREPGGGADLDSLLGLVGLPRLAGAFYSNF